MLAPTRRTSAQPFLRCGHPRKTVGSAIGRIFETDRPRTPEELSLGLRRCGDFFNSGAFTPSSQQRSKWYTEHEYIRKSRAAPSIAFKEWPSRPVPCRPYTFATRPISCDQFEDSGISRPFPTYIFSGLQSRPSRSYTCFNYSVQS